MQRLFLDANVVLDLVLERGSFSDDAEKIFKLKEEGEVELFVSTLTISHVACFAKKVGKDPFKTINILLYWIELVDLPKSAVENVLTGGFKDFEDGLQYFSALNIQGLDYIVTRDKRDYKASSIPVVEPSKLIKDFNR
jgi:predicted nucleic acid-binding protein